MTRRQLLWWLGGGATLVVVGGAAGLVLIDRGILPGKQVLNKLDGACSVPTPPFRFDPVGPSVSGRFFSRARQRSVGFTVAYPPKQQRGDELSLVVILHGYGDNHATALKGMTVAQAAALLPRVNPLAYATVDGGNGYWTPHSHDDPMGMVIDEFIPMLQSWGLGRPPSQIKLMGISMGGYGALALTESHPHLVVGVAAISPAIWTTYEQAMSANPSAFASRRTFERYNVISHAGKLSGIPLRVAAGTDDPFYPGIKSFVEAVPRPEKVDFGPGCHDDAFFLSQEAPSIEFLSPYVVHGGGLPA